MVVPILGGLYIGKWIDARFGTDPTFLLIFIVLGVIVSFMNLFKIGTKDVKNKTRK